MCRVEPLGAVAQLQTGMVPRLGVASPAAKDLLSEVAGGRGLQVLYKHLRPHPRVTLRLPRHLGEPRVERLEERQGLVCQVLVRTVGRLVLLDRDDGTSVPAPRKVVSLQQC